MLNPSRIKRREFLAGIGTMATVMSCNAAPKEELSMLQDTALLKEIQKREFPVSQGRSLNERAKAKGLFYGAYTSHRSFRKDPALQTAFKRDCGLVVGEVFFRFVQPEEGQFDWTATNVFFDFAQQNNMLLRGTPLVWHKLYPKWMLAKLGDSTTTRKDIESMLEKHISTVVRQYAGKTHSWDVVNEPIQIGTRDDGLRVNPWLRYMGVDYIDFAFRVAAEADPNSMLVLNEFGIEYSDRQQERKRRSLIKLLEQLKAKGTPIKALGMQAHLIGERPPSALRSLRQFLSEVAAMDLKILITELDVEDKRLPANRDFRDRLVASAYSDYLSIALDEKAVIGVITWGLSDRYTWLSENSPRSDQQAVRPLPLDDQMRPKFAWNAISRAFDNAPIR